MEWRRGPPSEKIVRVKRWSGAAKPEQEVTKKSGSNKIPQAERYDSAGPEVPKPKAAEWQVEPKIAEASTQVQKPKELQPTQELEKVEHKNAQKPAEKKEVKAEPKQERKFEAEEEVQPFDKREVQGKADWKGRKVVWRAVSEREAPKPEPEPKKEWKEWEDWKDWKDCDRGESRTFQLHLWDCEGVFGIAARQDSASANCQRTFRVTPTTGRGYRVALVKDIAKHCRETLMQMFPNTFEGSQLCVFHASSSKNMPFKSSEQPFRDNLGSVVVPCSSEDMLLEKPAQLTFITDELLDVDHCEEQMKSALKTGPASGAPEMSLRLLRHWVLQPHASCWRPATENERCRRDAHSKLGALATLMHTISRIHRPTFGGMFVESATTKHVRSSSEQGRPKDFKKLGVKPIADTLLAKTKQNVQRTMDNLGLSGNLKIEETPSELRRFLQKIDPTLTEQEVNQLLKASPKSERGMERLRRLEVPGAEFMEWILNSLQP
eukprot:g25444.t1